jgi:hypothetical protein
MIDVDKLKEIRRPHGMPFRIGKIGHVVINVRDIAQSLRFYTEVLGFEVSDIYPDEMVPGGMAFCAATRTITVLRSSGRCRRRPRMSN